MIYEKSFIFFKLSSSKVKDTEEWTIYWISLFEFLNFFIQSCKHSLSFASLIICHK